jgi:hypothetical protein
VRTIRAEAPMSLASAATTTVRMFSLPKHRIHRLHGLVYLAQYAALCVVELCHARPTFLLWTLPLSGFVQAIIASLSFRSLPRRQTQGYFSDRGVMSYEFVLENVFFSGLLLFQALYYSFRPFPRALLPVEVVFVFFPYIVIRPFFPKTSIRASYTADKERSERNDRVLGAFSRFTKVFYVTAKHFNGLFLNYLIFLGLLTAEQDRLMGFLFLLAGWGTTIAMFLQTLKVKKYIGPRTALLAYMAMFPFAYGCYSLLVGVTIRHAWVAAVTAVGLALNFGPRWVQIGWQCVVCAVCLYVRFG